jgi:hypothetical protein
MEEKVGCNRQACEAERPLYVGGGSWECKPCCSVDASYLGRSWGDPCHNLQSPHRNLAEFLHGCGLCDCPT